MEHDWDGTGIYSFPFGGRPEKLGELKPREALVIKDRRHSRYHIAIVPPKELLERLAGTTAMEAVIEYVRSVLN